MTDDQERERDAEYWKAKAVEIEKDRDYILRLLFKAHGQYADLLEEQSLPPRDLPGNRVPRRMGIRQAQHRWFQARKEAERYRLAWLSARRGRNLWHALYCEAVTGRRGEMNVVSRDLYRQHVQTVARDNRRAWARVHMLEDELSDLRLAYAEIVTRLTAPPLDTPS